MGTKRLETRWQSLRIETAIRWQHKQRRLTLQSTGHAPASRVMPVISNVRHRGGAMAISRFSCLVAALILSAPAMLGLLSLIAGLHSSADQGSSIGVMVLLTIAALVAGFNFYLSFVRPALFSHHNGSLQGYRFISGIPILGSILATFGVLFAWGQFSIAAFMLLLLVVDTGSPLFALIAIYRGSSSNLSVGGDA